MISNLRQALVLLAAQNLRAGIMGKAFCYSSLAYQIEPADQAVNEVHAYACLLSRKPEEALKVINFWASEGREMTHNLLVVKSYAELKLNEVENAAATLNLLLGMLRREPKDLTLL